MTPAPTRIAMSLSPDIPPAAPIPLPPPPVPAGPSRCRILKDRLGRRRVAVPALLILLILAGAWRYRVTRPDYRYARGRAAVEAGEWAAAERYAARLERAGRADHAHLLRAESLFGRRDWEGALAECNRIRDEAALRLKAATLSGRCLLELGAMAEAERVFLFVINQQPDDVDAHRGLAAITYESGQWNRSIAHLEQVAKLDPADARPHRLLAEILRDSSNLEGAVAEYREAIRLGSGMSAEAGEETRFELVEALLQLTRYAEALAVLEEAGPPDREPLYMQALRAEALRGLGRRAEALAIVEAAMSGRPDGAFFRLRGQLYLDDGNAVAAVPLLEEAARRSPNHYQSHFLLAQAYAAVGRKPDADRLNARAEAIRKDYELAAQLQHEAMARPRDALVRIRLAELCERTGDTKSAAIWRRAAAQLQGQGP